MENKQEKNDDFSYVYIDYINLDTRKIGLMFLF